MFTRWNFPKSNTSEITQLAKETGLPAFVCQLLLARGYTDADKVKTLRESPADTLPDPFSFKDMDRAVAATRDAIEKNQTICVYGDYDCDGVTSTTILASCLNDMGANVTYYIPDRFSEGYGMNKSAIRKIHAAGTGLIITVDNGISAHDEIAYAHELGMRVIVTDHHTPRETLPDALAVVDPHREDCTSLFKGLAGVGVAFYFVCALTGVSPAVMLDKYSDILAIGTVADVVPLVEDNRIFVKRGLRKIAENPCIGVAALSEVAGVGDRVTSSSLGFSFGPRINAAGRVEHAKSVVKLFMTEDVEYAKTEAARLNQLNLKRKDIEAAITENAIAKLADNPKLLEKRIIVVAGEDWSNGVIGIVASRLTETFGKPAIVLEIKGDVAKGSGRSIEGISLIKAITACSEHLEGYGGHNQAAGLSIRTERIDAFAGALDAFCAKEYPIMPVPAYRIDCVLEPTEATIRNVEALSILDPFGEGNPHPMFCIRNVEILNVQALKEDKHQRVSFKKSSCTFEGMYFQMNSLSMPYSKGDMVDILIELNLGEYRGKPQLTFNIKAMRPAGFDFDLIASEYEQYLRYKRGEYRGEDVKAALYPSRELIGDIYRNLRSKIHSLTVEGLYSKVDADTTHFGAVCMAVDVLMELDFVEKLGSVYTLKKGQPNKRNLEESEILRGLALTEGCAS